MKTATLLLLLCFSAAPVAAQRDCALRVTTTNDTTGYRARTGDRRCEGMYVGLQAEPLKVQPISFVKGGLRFPAKADAASRNAMIRAVAVPERTTRLQLIGRGAESNLNWALDAELAPGSVVNWNLGEVVIPVGLTDDKIGVLALVPAGSPSAEPVLVPVEVMVANAPGADRSELELIFRVPGAGAARWWIEGESTAKPAEALNADGFFRA